MKTKKIFLIITSFFVIFFTSCEEQVLNKSSLTSFTENDIWNDPKLVEMLVTTSYNALPGWGWPSPSGGPFLSTASDEAFMMFNYGMWALSSGNIDANNMGALSSNWRRMYSTIRDVNVFLSRIDGVPTSAADKPKMDLLKAEMKYIRARAYAELVNFYGGVPLITKVYALDDEFKENRASYKDCVAFIVKELDEAATALPVNRTGSQLGKVSKAACLALKSELLLYAASKLHDPSSTITGPFYTYDVANKWQQASDAAKAVIDLNVFSLVPINTWTDYTKIFTGASNNEIIFARWYSSDVNHQNIDKTNSSNGYRGWSGNVPTQELVNAFEMSNGKKITDPTSGYDPKDMYKDRDPRFYGNIVYQGATYRGRQTEFYLPGGRDSRDGPESWNYAVTAYTMRKYMDENIDFNVAIGSQPFIHFRLAEIYLNYAEAQYYLDNESVAREYVNKIRTRAKMPDITSSGSQLIADVMQERRVELAFEDHRFFDIRRWMIADQVMKNSTGIQWKKLPDETLEHSFVNIENRTWNNRMYYLPIPLEEINKTGLPQNPGY